MRVAIAEDSVLLREGLARLLADAGFDVVARCHDADELRHAMRVQLPDVVIVDIRLPPTHTDEGIQAAMEIRAAHPGIGVLVLSQRRASAICSRTASATSLTSSTPYGGSRRAARPSTRRSSPRSCPGGAATTRSPS